MASNQYTVSKQQILDFLREVRIMNAAFANGEQPVSTVLLFAVEDNFTFYVATLKNSYKNQAILTNNNISFNVWHHKKFLVQADGTMELLNSEAALTALDKIVDSAVALGDFWPPVLQIKGHDYVVFKITPTWLRALNLQAPGSVVLESLFTTLINEKYDPNNPKGSR